MKKILYIFIIVLIFICNTINAFQLDINAPVQYIRPGVTYNESKDKPNTTETFLFPPGEKVTVIGKWVEPYEITGLPLTYHPIYINNSGTINAQISWGTPNAPDYIYFEIEMENDLANVFLDRKNKSRS